MQYINFVMLIGVTLLPIADHLTGTAFYQRKGKTMTLIHADQFDIFDADEEDGTAPRYGLPEGFHLLTDVELDGLTEDIDDITDDEDRFVLEYFYPDSREYAIAEELFYEEQREHADWLAERDGWY